MGAGRLRVDLGDELGDGREERREDERSDQQRAQLVHPLDVVGWADVAVPVKTGVNRKCEDMCEQKV